ncbi:MAG TPA: VWA domain-containing protein [Polyangiaceae bacterium LLY-WYZ-15_(1-7)]|nr:hypothetical protein [Myxococcales bacterium]MAT25915.1 hypothetical protein [Sandaracinus sp.]HJK94669.1 VWA domain-containing protein [Polyangiaceae bacterium LLY-WYZ-15_(1-7)]MBJ71306.1 hypothetical protein [Sandaracinus sp.]HJL02280.1 VWA domain-containing protein [Polyangiaceae bacterium LLY-WYZ-15_(1-7)]
MSTRPALSRLLLLALAGCTAAGLQPTDMEIAEDLDHLVDIRGDFCAQPDAEIRFPVKVLFLVDQSTSLQCTDSRNRRFEALRDLTDDLTDAPDTSVGFIGFSSWARVQPFTRDRSAIGRMLDPAGGLGPATDYQGTLAQAVRMLEEDMEAVGPAERARTRYVVVFLSDGVPTPRCLAGCEDTISDCSDGVDNDGDGLEDGSDPDCENITDNALHPDNLYGICNTTEEIPEGEYVDFDGRCPAYNAPGQILRRVDEVLALRDVYGVGAITLHTVLLFSPQEVVDGVCGGDAAAAFGYEETQARSLLTAMAEQGNGAFRDANLATDDDSFLQFDFRALDTPQALQGLLARNGQARYVEGELRVDTDGDGLVDELESAEGTDPRSLDGDGDGYTDAFERAFAGDGFDPTDPNAPAVRCLDTGDLDGDGLRDCEEDRIETDARRPDTDRDRIPDGLEVILGTDPRGDDALSDRDFDGVANGDEARGGTDPSAPDEDTWRNERIQYGLEDLGRHEVTDADGRTATRRCHRFEVRRVPLVVTPLPEARGRNRILVYAQEQPAMLGGAETTTSVACFEALYLGGRVKHPSSGLIDVTEEAWGGLRETILDRFDALGASCGWFTDGAFAGEFSRNRLRDAVEACMPEQVPLGEFAYPNADLRDLLGDALRNDGSPRMPDHPAALFTPIEVFDPERDCHRPWELERLLALLDAVAETCGACGRWTGEGEAPSPCCPGAPAASEPMEEAP